MSKSVNPHLRQRSQEFLVVLKFSASVTLLVRGRVQDVRCRDERGWSFIPSGLEWGAKYLERRACKAATNEDWEKKKKEKQKIISLEGAGFIGYCGRSSTSRKKIEQSIVKTRSLTVQCISESLMDWLWVNDYEERLPSASGTHRCLRLVTITKQYVRYCTDVSWYFLIIHKYFYYLCYVILRPALKYKVKKK